MAEHASEDAPVDIVARLRRWASMPSPGPSTILTTAADEIERLRDLLAMNGIEVES